MTAALCSPSSTISTPALRLFSPAYPSTPLCHLRPLRSSRPAFTRPCLRHSGCLVVAEKNDVYRVIGTAAKSARDVLEAGTKLVPEPVPRPLAQAGVAVTCIFILSYVLKSVFSVILFILAIGSVSFLIFFYLNKDDDQGSNGGGGGLSNDRTLEDARRIMEKYK